MTVPRITKNYLRAKEGGYLEEYLENRAIAQEYQRRYYEDHPEKREQYRLASAARHTAKKQNPEYLARKVEARKRSTKNIATETGIAKSKIHLGFGTSRYVKVSLVHSAKSRARKQGVEFSITALDLEWPEFCPILGTQLIYEIGDGKEDRTKIPWESLPSLDRVVPEYGYVRGNVAVISAKANTIKNNGTADEHRAIASFMDQWMKDSVVEFDW